MPTLGAGNVGSFVAKRVTLVKGKRGECNEDISEVSGLVADWQFGLFLAFGNASSPPLHYNHKPNCYNEGCAAPTLALSNGGFLRSVLLNNRSNNVFS